jgi:hypothetical protein
MTRCDHCGCCDSNDEGSRALLRARLFLTIMQSTWAVTQVWELLAR